MNSGYRSIAAGIAVLDLDPAWGIRGTALDVTTCNGHVYVALISGGAKFCTGSTCRSSSKSCDYVEVTGRKITEPKRVSNGLPDVTKT